MDETTMMRYWHFYITLPPNSERKYKQNKYIGIVAPDINACIFRRFHA